MTDYNYKERRFSIDPGKGRKMDGCPYSVYEDGRDVKDYIIPPKGYLFKGFRFDPEASNQIYDGKLIAEYEKEAFNDILKSNLWKFILAFAIIAVIAVVVLLAASVFNDPKPSHPSNEPQPVVQVVDTPTHTEEVVPVTVNTNDITTSQEEENDTVEQSEEPKEPQPAQQFDPNDPNALFNAKFWTLVHQREMKMDPYDSLFKANKNQVTGEEYDYLYHTILKDYATFKDWSGKLKKIPDSELESTTTIKDLIQKINATK